METLFHHAQLHPSISCTIPPFSRGHAEREYIESGTADRVIRRTPNFQRDLEIDTKPYATGTRLD